MAHTWTVHYAGIDLPWNTVIGPGFRITHGWGLVISHGAEIGCNVTVFHGTTIGQADRIGSNNERVTSYPIIEDSVWIGPHAIIVGGVRIGRGSRITGGTFVIHNVAAFSLVGGNPMRILRKRVMPDVVNPADVSSKVDEP
jgi:serine O-acetyltransferase